MGAMPAETGQVWVDHGSPFTVDDLEAMPDDGHRYELIDGTLIVSPAPGRRHQKVVYRLYRVLEDACPDEFDVLGAPFRVRVSQTTELQPDVLVGRYEDFTENLLPVAPVLAVEVFSPSSVVYDINTKRAVYQRLGVASYWLIDPEDPTLTVYELNENGVYYKTAVVKGKNAFEAERPFPVRIVPVELLDKLAR